MSVSLERGPIGPLSITAALVGSGGEDLAGVEVDERWPGFARVGRGAAAAGGLPQGDSCRRPVSMLTWWVRRFNSAPVSRSNRSTGCPVLER